MVLGIVNLFVSLQIMIFAFLRHIAEREGASMLSICLETRL